MDDRIRALLADGFRVVPSRDANHAISRARRERAGSDPDDEDGAALRSYEIILTDWQSFATSQLPKLVYHLESIGAHLPACRGVMISAFAGDELHFVDAAPFLATAARLLGLTTEQLSERHGTGERRSAVGQPPLLALPTKS